MFSPETGSRVAVPALVLAIITYLTQLICGYHNISVYELAVYLVAVVIVEFFALLTCYPLVIARGKDQRHVWANYIIWTFLANAGNIVSAFS